MELWGILASDMLDADQDKPYLLGPVVQSMLSIGDQSVPMLRFVGRGFYSIAVAAVQKIHR